MINFLYTVGFVSVLALWPVIALADDVPAPPAADAAPGAAAPATNTAPPAVAPPSGRENRLGTRPLRLLLTGELVVLVAYTTWWIVVDARPVGWTRLVLLGAIALAMGGQSAAARQLGNPNVGTTDRKSTRLNSSH